MNRPPAGPLDLTGAAEAHLNRLGAQVAAMRTVLVQLLQQIVVAQGRLDRSQADLLLEANEQLVVSALEAHTDAESAHGALDQVSRLGSLDPLTGLPNRALLLARFETAIVNAKRHGNRVALLFLDLDAFKQINDTLGHAAGDHALQLVADSLSSMVRETDTVSRHGGDEFLVLLAEVNRADDAEIVADKVHAALATYRQLDGHPVELRASVGISVYPEDGADPATLIARADAAMYAAKRRQQESEGHTAPRERAPADDAAATETGRSQAPRASAHELSLIEHEQRQQQLREANEQLVMAALGAQELLASAMETRRRQSELLAMIADELSSPHAPIRLAAATLGMPGAEDALLLRARAVIEAQADKLSRMVRALLDPQHGPTAGAEPEVAAPAPAPKPAEP